MAVGFPTKTTYANGDVFSASDINDTNGTLNTLNPTAKGSIISASAANTASRLAVGTNNSVLIADSAETTGLRWGGDWTTWTPTYSGFTIGNATVTARYQQIGKLVNVYLKIVWGSTTSFTSFPAFSLPVSSANTAYTTGNAYLQDTGTGSTAGAIYIETSSVFQFVAYGASGSFANNAFFSSNTVPFTWTNTDQMVATFTYEAA